MSGVDARLVTRARGATGGAARRSRMAILGWLFAACCGCGPLQAATITEQMAIACHQPETLRLQCTYRLRDGSDLELAVAEWQGEVVDARMGNRYPATGATTAILLLVDTSDPARQAAVDQAIVHIDRILDEPATHRRFGLASFDTELFMLAPLGSSVEDVRRAAHALQARGKTTELFRNVRDAVRILGRDSATRKALLIISDGLAEDYAYGHEDVVALALEQSIIISGIGLPRSVGQSVALQTLRRLADETGGTYIQADHLDFHVPAGALPHWLATLDAGGEFDVDLKPFAAAGATGTVDLSLSFQSSRQSFIVLAPVDLGDAPAPAATPPTESLVPTPAALPPSPPAASPGPVSNGFGLGYLSLLALLLLILGLLVVFFQRIKRQVAAARVEPPRNPLAYLILQDPPATRHVIDKTPWRIGRSRSADLTLTDHSVSRLHAEIRSSEDGSLTLNDLDSLNGVFVNDNRIDVMQLREGDTVDIGDVRLLFTLHDENYATQDATVLVRTRTPL